MGRLRIWHLGLAVLWVALLSWLAVMGRSAAEAPAVLTSWIAASAISLGCTRSVRRPLARGALGRGLFLASLLVGALALIGVVAEKLEACLRLSR